MNPLRRLSNAAVLAPVLAFAFVLGIASDAFAEDVDLMAPVDLPARVDNARKLVKKDVVGLAKALVALGDSKTENPDVVEFLVEFTVREPSRVIRLFAIDAAKRLDEPRAAELFVAKADGKNRLQTVFALHGLGYVGGKEHVDAAIELAQNKNEMIAVQACRTLAQLPSKKKVQEIIDLGIDHPKAHVGDHAAWTVQDLLKKPKIVLGKYARVAKKKKDEERAIRAASTIALLEDKLAGAHKWGTTGTALRKLLENMPAAVEIEGLKPEYTKRIEETVAWMKEKVPGQWLGLRLATKKISASGKEGVSYLDAPQAMIHVPLKYTVQRPPKLAYHIGLHAGVLLQKDIDQPWTGHRGWEASLFDIYDLCIPAKLWDVGPGKTSRRAFLEDRIAARPWGGD